ncbi:unnamed protein product [Agarophyton chilense]
MRCFFLSSVLTVLASIRIATSLVHRVKHLPDGAHSYAFSLHPNAEALHFDYSLSDVKPGTSLVTACQNGHEKLRRSLPTWIQQANLNEIVIVDWGSKPPLHYVVEEVDIHFENHAPVHVVHVKKAGDWIASQALNFAFQAAQYTHILKVSCSHELEPDFTEHHRLKPNSFIVGGSHLERVRDEEFLKDILFVSRKTLVGLGGYDERLREGGGEQDDLIERLSAKGMRRVDLDYDKVFSNHIHDEDLFRFHSARMAKEIDLDLKKRMSPWNPNDFNDSTILGRKILEEQCRTTKSFRHPLVYYSVLNKSTSVSSFRKIASPEMLISVERTVLTRNLYKDFGLPWCLLKTLSLPALRNLISLYNLSASIPETKIIIVDCFSSLPARINLLLSGLVISKQTGRALVVLWERILETDHTNFNSSFIVPQNVVILDDFHPKNTTDRENCGGKSFSNHVALRSAGHNPIMLKENLQNVVYLMTDMPVKSENIKLLNERLMSKEFNSLQLAGNIEDALFHLKDIGLESSIGLYIGSHSEGKNSSHGDKLEIFTAMQREVKKIRQKRGMWETKLYIDADKSFIHRFHNEEKNMIDNSWLLNERDNKLAFPDHLTRVVALSRTKTFTSFLDDETSNLIGILRRG